MELEESLIARKSCRKFGSKSVPDKHIKKILWAASRAPFASGGPRRHVIVVRDKARKKALQKACFNQSYVGECDTVFVVCGLDLKTKLRQHPSAFPKFVHDCDAANMCMDLMAVSLGLNTCWIGHFDLRIVKRILGCKGRPTMILLVGYKL